ncbi:MAG: anion permease [Bryobacterales bacterium]|nr:anion permease [Bryobacterales bacterium]
MTSSQPRSSPLIDSSQLWKFGVLLAVYFFVVLAIPRPEPIKAEGWRLLGIFLATVAGLILQPIAGGALVLLAVTLSSVLGGLKIGQALEGYADTSVWLVVAAFMISRALINTGLARRIALLFVRMFGKSSLGVCYSLSLTDVVLASIIPSNALVPGGSPHCLSAAYGSNPGHAGLWAFLFASVYRYLYRSAMFFTGQASNPWP